MSDDLLDQAARALAQETRADRAQLDEAKRRLLQRFAADKAPAKRSSSGVRRLVWMIPLAATFTVGVAVASMNAFLPPRETTPSASASTSESPSASAPAARTLSSHFGGSPSHTELSIVPPAADPATPFAPIAPVPSAPEAVNSPDPAPPAPVSKPAATSAPLSTPSAITRTSPPQVASPVPAPSSPQQDALDADLQSYRQAHRLHFTDHNYSAALVAWNDYLAKFPSGTFAIEARYSRAFCLVRLGDKQRAREALRPFAEGRVAGGYRRAEARAMLDALGEPPAKQ